MTEEIRELINASEVKGDFTYPSIDRRELGEAASELEIVIPAQYEEFLLTYGHGGG